jgi:hypothetical protein
MGFTPIVNAAFIYFVNSSFIAMARKWRDYKQMVDFQGFDARLRAVMDALECPRPVDLARYLGVDAQKLNNWTNVRKRVSVNFRRPWEEKTGISFDWINENLGSMWLPGRGPNKVAEDAGHYLRPLTLWNNPADLPPDQYLFFPALEYYLSAGNGGPDPNTYNPYSDADNRAAFRADFAANEGWHPKTHYTMRAKGESMEPTIQNGAPVVIATNDKFIRSGKIYAILIDGEPLLKRLDKLPGGVVRIRSDNSSNPAYAPFEVAEAAVEVIGRAVWTPLKL